MGSNHGSRTLIKHISNTHSVQLMGIGFMRPEVPLGVSLISSKQYLNLHMVDILSKESGSLNRVHNIVLNC